jgi:hypothetical protein
MKKTITSQPEKLKVDSMKKFLTNSAYYASISTIALGTTISLGTNEAQAGDVSTATAFSAAATTGAASVIVTTAGTVLTFNSTANVISDVLAITDTVEGNIIITSAGDSSPTAANAAVDFLSIVLDAAAANTNAHSNIVIEDIDDRTGTFIVTIDGTGTAANGDLTAEGTLIIRSLEDTDTEAMGVVVTDTVNIRGATAISTAGAGAVTFTIGATNVATNTTFTGGVTLTESAAGLATLNVINHGIITGTIASAADDTGTLILAGANTVAGTVGISGGFNLDEVQTDGATVFNLAVAAKTVDINAATTITGATTATTLTVNAASTLTGAVAATTVDIDSATVASSTLTATTVTVDANTTVTGNLTAITSVTMGADDVLTLAGSAIDFGTTGAIVTHDSSPAAGITFSSDVTVDGNINADDTDDVGIITMNGDTTVNDKLGAVAGKNLLKGVVAAGKRLTLKSAGNYVNQVDFGNAAELEIGKGVTSTAFFATTAMVTANLKDTGVTKIYMPINLANNGTLELFQGASDTTLVTNLNEGLQDNDLEDLVASKPTTGDYLITAVPRSAKEVASRLSISANEARALAASRIAAIDDTQVDDTLEEVFYNLITAQGSFAAADRTAFAKQVAPQTDAGSGSAISTRAMTGTVQGIVSNRMASLRSGDAYVTGMAAGSNLTANSGFIQVFGSQAEQDNIKLGGITTFGFDSETKGIAIGFDGLTENGSTVGISASMSDTDLKGKGTGLAKNSIESHTVSVYADKSTDSGYVEGSLTYGINDNTGSRRVDSAGVVRSYKSNYDSQQISAKIAVGAPTEVTGGTFLTPYGSLTGTIISTDVYTETSNTSSDNLRLKVAQSDINSLVGSVGVRAHVVTNLGTPMISFAINNEFGDTNIDANNTYQGGGTAFKTSTDTEEMSATLGVGYTFGNDLSSINFSYEGEANDSDYLNHYGSVKIVSKF